MPKGYWIAHMDVKDAETYEKYRAANAKPLAAFGGKFVVRGGTQQVAEGNWSPRTVIIEFPSYADAVACYESADYQQAKDIRLTASDNNMVIVEGYEN
ncbi:DUF1330 domain-containing protein [Marimonas sp. MJW-29]|uniref:DUF1330 domain-containing protein n=1 Tax=Sulfitobacter sediminis TaxID=3234186 RepID=A0ABV3RIY0_9RHOB